MIFLSPSPEVGSSKKTTGGFPMSAKQSDSFRFCPPDKAPSIRQDNMKQHRNIQQIVAK